jgi:succinate dehydrogenase subunit C
MKEIASLPVKTFKRKMPILWWIKRASYFRFIFRELTSLAVAYFAILLLLLIKAISQSEDAYHQFNELLKTPIMILLSMVALVGLLYHSVTWFNLAPKAMVVKLGKFRVPDIFIILSNYIGWMVISVIIWWLLL